MIIDAYVSFLKPFIQFNITKGTNVCVSVDCDYVKSNEDDIAQWVENELQDEFGRSFVYREDFEINNLDKLIEELTCDEDNDTF